MPETKTQAREGGARGGRSGARPSTQSMRARLVDGLADNIHELGRDGLDTQIFAFLTTHDHRLIEDLRQAAAWLETLPGGASRLAAADLAERRPDALACLSRLAIARALTRLHRQGSLGSPTFEHPDTQALVRRLQAEVSAAVGDSLAEGALAEQVMRVLAGAEPRRPTARAVRLSRLVVELAARPLGLEPDLVAMACELALGAEDDSPGP